MGYTHYWERPTALPRRKFGQAARACWRAVDRLASKHGIKVQRESDDKRPGIFDNDRIAFNGRGEEGYEPFEIERVFEPSYPEQTPSMTGLWFACCKTVRKPYDAAVCACLIVLKHHFGENFIVSSDGDDEEEGWPIARQVCQQVLGYGADFSLLISGLERLPRRGLPYHRQASSSLRKDYRLSNDWLMFREKGVVTLHENDMSRTLITTARNLTTARWAATVAYLERMLTKAVAEEPAVNLKPFLLSAAESLHDWTPLAALADALEDRDDLRHRVLRALLPRAL